MKLRQYLLSLVSDEEQNKIEERFFADDEYFENMLAAEDELAEAYASGELSRRERKRFDEYLLPNPKWQQKVANIRALKHIVNEENIKVSPEKISLLEKFVDWGKDFVSSLFEQKMVIGLSYAAILVLIIFSSVWVGRQFQNFQGKIVSLEAGQSELAQEGNELRQQLEQQTGVASEFAEKFEQEKQQRLKLEQILDKIKPQPTQMLAFSLEPGLLRDSGEPKRLIIPGAMQSVQLELILDSASNYKNYAVTIKTVEGNEIWSKSGLQAQQLEWGQKVIVNVPTIALPLNDYILRLKSINAEGAFEVIHSYFFGVLRK
jgi:hypothetical protein